MQRRDWVFPAGKSVAIALVLAAAPSLASAAASPSPADAANVAREAQRDLTADGYYNKPGATRSEYDRDWQECRLIARGSNGTGSGSGIVGALVSNAIEQGKERRENRQTCMLFKGWRVIHPTNADRANLAAMAEAARNAQLDNLLGSKDVPYNWVEALPKVEAYPFALDYINRVVTPGEPPVPTADPATKLTLAPGQGAVLIGIRRPDNFGLGQPALVQFDRYDVQKHDRVVAPSGSPADGVTYGFTLSSRNKRAPLEYYVFQVTSGDYVLSSVWFGTADKNPGGLCLAAPLLHVAAGEIAYVGDFIPVWNARIRDGSRLYTMGYAYHPEDAAAYAKTLPGAPGPLVPANIHNGASFPCNAATMTGYRIPGKPDLPAGG